MSATQPARASKRFLRPWLRLVLGLTLLVSISALSVFGLEQWVVHPYRIPTASMEPTLHCARNPAQDSGCLGSQSDRVLVNRFIYTFDRPQRNQIVVFTPPAAAAVQCGERGAFVKRLVGLPGEQLHEDSRGFLWVRYPPHARWVELREPYLTSRQRLADSAHFGGTWYVPRGSYFMIGDNRSKSCDSRRFGAVPAADLVGPVVAIYWPWSRISIAAPGLFGGPVLAVFAMTLGLLVLLGAVARAGLRRSKRRASSTSIG